MPKSHLSLPPALCVTPKLLMPHTNTATLGYAALPSGALSAQTPFRSVGTKKRAGLLLTTHQNAPGKAPEIRVHRAHRTVL